MRPGPRSGRDPELGGAWRLVRRYREEKRENNTKRKARPERKAKPVWTFLASLLK
ncbi:MAG: hypothetical protein LIQ31_10065 [Planctomycetes bacterium]|nr:hypothetical protein [Planctomycetota bacterium]